MAIFYSKKSLTLVFTILLSAQIAQAQTVTKKPVTLKLDEQGRAYYLDQDGDRVIVLDYKTRKSLQAVSSYKKEDLNTAKMYPKTFYKESVPDKFDDPKPVFKNYTIEEGDTWEGISTKLYETPEYWAQLKLWNEDLQKDPKLPAGAELKYLELPKK